MSEAHSFLPTFSPTASLQIDVAVEDSRWQDFIDTIKAHIDYLWQALLEKGLVVNIPCEISLLLSDDARLADLNETYRGKEGATNVLAFPADETMPAGIKILGDIALSYARVATEAASAGLKFEHRALHLITHGLLHLLGYTHDDDKTAGEMEALEITLLGGCGIQNPYSEIEQKTKK